MTYLGYRVSSPGSRESGGPFVAVGVMPGVDPLGPEEREGIKVKGENPVTLGVAETTGREEPQDPTDVSLTDHSTRG